MLKTSKSKFIVSITLIISIICLSISIDLNSIFYNSSDNRNFLQFGENAYADFLVDSSSMSNPSGSGGGSGGSGVTGYIMLTTRGNYLDVTIPWYGQVYSFNLSNTPISARYIYTGTYGTYDGRVANFTIEFNYNRSTGALSNAVLISGSHSFGYGSSITMGSGSNYVYGGVTNSWIGCMVYANYAIYVKNNNPTISISSPTSGTFSEVDTSVIPQISVSDADNNTLTCKYYIDSETIARDTKTISNTTTIQVIGFIPVDMSTLSEGNHSIKFEVSDGVDKPITSTINFKVDKSAPTLGTVVPSSTINTITISGSATDTISGLDANPYRYTVGSSVSSWLTTTSYTSPDNLIPNTQYAIKFEARDGKGHVANISQNLYTKAAVPVITVNNASSYTLDILTSDNNPPSTQYQISVNSGEKYVTQEGSLTSAPTWITLNGKKVTAIGLTPSVTYDFQAKARNAENIETALSASVSGTTLVAPPGSPANIIATATDKTITVSWDGVNEAIGYDIEVDGSVINTGTGTTYTHIGLSPGTPHTYRVRAKNAGGPGNWSAAVSKSTLPGSPDIPANLNAIPLSTSITVTWSNVPGATGYDIEVDGTLVNNGPNTNYIHNSLTPGTHHSYRVRSINPGGKSEWSGYVNVTTLLDTSPVPTNLTAVPDKSSITLSWDAVNGASGYDIEVDGVAINNGTRTTYTHSNLAPDTQHIYRVRSKKGGATSEWSAAVVSATIADVFGTPLNFKANAGDTSVFLSWDPVSQAVGYDVEVDGVAADNGTDTTSMHNGLVSNSSHTYRVRARSATETSEWSAPLASTTFGLPTPEDVSAVSDETSITSVWQAVYGATSYDLEFDGSIVPGIPDTTYTSSGLNPNSQHVIRVRAVNESGTSNWSLPLTKSTLFGGGNVPSVSGMSRTTSITLMWNAMNGTTGYDIEADGTIISDVTGTYYTFNGLIAGTQHTYRVRAENSSGIGNWSNAFTVSTLPQGPAAPTNVAASSNMTSILVTWDQVAGATEYEIEADGTIISNGSGTSYLHTGLTPDTNHTYKVRSKNTAGYSSWSTATAMRTLSSVQTFDVNSTVGEEFGLVLAASAIQDLSGYTFTVKYNTDDFEVTDLCGLTSKLDTQAGDISGTDITVTQVAPGTIVFTKTGSTQSWQVWSGIVNSIKFKSKRNGQSTITYTIQ